MRASDWMSWPCRHRYQPAAPISALATSDGPQVFQQAVARHHAAEAGQRVEPLELGFQRLEREVPAADGDEAAPAARDAGRRWAAPASGRASRTPTGEAACAGSNTRRGRSAGRWPSAPARRAPARGRPSAAAPAALPPRPGAPAPASAAAGLPRAPGRSAAGRLPVGGLHGWLRKRTFRLGNKGCERLFESTGKLKWRTSGGFSGFSAQ
jgi:hypothetical protein